MASILCLSLLVLDNTWLGIFMDHQSFLAGSIFSSFCESPSSQTEHCAKNRIYVVASAIMS